MPTYYISKIEPSTTHEGQPIHNGILIVVRDGLGNDIPIRLIPGFDPYLTAVIINKGEYGFYRFDRRMRSMSDQAELSGLNSTALRQILRECQRNLKSSTNGIYFLNNFTGDLDMPILQRDNYHYAVRNKDKTIMSLIRYPSNACYFEFSTTIRACFNRLGVKVESLNQDLQELLLRLGKSHYDRRHDFHFTRLLSSKD